MCFPDRSKVDRKMSSSVVSSARGGSKMSEPTRPIYLMERCLAVRFERLSSKMDAADATATPKTPSTTLNRINRNKVTRGSHLSTTPLHLSFSIYCFMLTWQHVVASVQCQVFIRLIGVQFVISFCGVTQYHLVSQEVSRDSSFKVRIKVASSSSHEY